MALYSRATIILPRNLRQGAPFSPRLRRVVIRAIECTWRSELKVSGLEIVRLLNCLDVDVDDVVEKYEWGRLLVDVIYSPTGPGSLSPRYWSLLTLLRAHAMDYGSRGMEVARSLEEAEDWEKLEAWMTIAWQSTLWSKPMEYVGQATLRLLSRQPSALPRFENLCETGIRWMDQKDELRRICDQARREQSPPEPPPPCVFRLSPPLIPPFLFPQSIGSRPTIRSPSFRGRRHVLSLFIVYTTG